MNDKEAFEDIIADKFDQVEFPFDEMNWDGAEEMISSHRKKEKRRRFGFIFFSGIALGILIMLPFVIKMNDSQNNMIADAAKTKNENIDAPVLNTEVQAADQKSETNSTKQEALVNINTNETSDKQIAEKHTKTKGVNNINKNHLFGKPGKNKAHGLPAFTNHYSSVKLPTNLDEKPVDSIPLLESIVKLTPIPATLDSVIASKNDSATMVNWVDVPDSKNKTSLINPWNFSIGMGGNYVKNFSFNPIQGIEITYSILPKLEVGTGAYYTFLSMHSGGVKTITTHTSYGFGYQADVTAIKTNKLHYVVFPVFAKYKLNDKNAFVVGANIFALLTSSNSVTTYKESYGEKQNTVSKKTSGYSNGINSYDIGLLAGYKRYLFGNLSASIYFNYGLKDIKKNDYYGENKFDRNISGQFMLTYKL